MTAVSWQHLQLCVNEITSWVAQPAMTSCCFSVWIQFLWTSYMCLSDLYSRIFLKAVVGENHPSSNSSYVMQHSQYSFTTEQHEKFYFLFIDIELYITLWEIWNERGDDSLRWWAATELSLSLNASWHLPQAILRWSQDGKESLASIIHGAKVCQSG